MSAENPPQPRRYRGRSTEELKAERRERLLSAALDLFSNRGYQNTPVDVICSTAKVTTRHFYQHFKNREDLLLALLMQIREEVSTRAIQVLKADKDPQTRALDTLEVIADFYLGDKRYARIGSLETVGVSTRVEQFRREAIHQFAQLIVMAAQDLMEIGLLPRRDYHLPAIALVGACNELVVEWLTSETGLTAEDMSREIRTIFKSMIAGSKPRG